MTTTQRIDELSLEEEPSHPRTTEIRHEIDIAMRDLITANRFDPKEFPTGPYHAALRVAEQRVVLNVRTLGGSINEAESLRLTLPLTPLRSIIRDYFLMFESYQMAMQAANAFRIEAVDVGRRAVHNEGSEKLMEMLESKVATDHNTARRLFTLIAALCWK